MTTTDSTPRTFNVDFTDVRVLIQEALVIMDDYDNRDVPADFVNGRTRNNTGETAEVNRDLLRLKDVLTAAAGEVGMLYWAFKSYPDPRFTS